jgi:hypothetical protein
LLFVIKNSTETLFRMTLYTKTGSRVHCSMFCIFLIFYLVMVQIDVLLEITEGSLILNVTVGNHLCLEQRALDQVLMAYNCV